MATVYGVQRPTIMLYPPFVEAMGQCRIELVRRETELMFTISKGLGTGVLGKSWPQTFLDETRADIAKIDALFGEEKQAKEAK